MDDLIRAILGLDIYLQRQIYARWPQSWVQMKWPIGATRALLIIESGYAHTPGEVAEVMKIGKTTVTGILDRLETDGLITRTLDPDDRRSFVLALTDTGRELVQQIDNLRRDPLKRALQAMEVADLEALYQGLEALTQAMNIDKTKAPIIEKEHDLPL